MSEPAAPVVPAPAPRAGGREWRRTLVLGAAVVVGLVVAYAIGTAVIPRWWAHRIGDQVDGSILAGIGIGLFYGFVFTLVPLIVIGFALRRGRSWKMRGWIAAVALVLALPNLFTLGIVLGNGGAAHAGERTLDVEAPDFRAASLVGAIVAVLAFVGLRYLIATRRRGKRRESSLRDELKARDEAAKASAEG